MLRRKAYDRLVEWKNTKSTQALLVTGARQVGKTYLIREFARAHYRSFVEINLVDDAAAAEAFAHAKNSDDLLSRITAFARGSLVAGQTLIFIDEVQMAREVLTFIKFLVQNTEYDYVLSGSVLGVELKGIRSVPVGYLHTVDMYPLDFEEFCWANGLNESVLDRAREHLLDERPLEDYLHTRLLDLFHRYLIVGGMPNPVSVYADTKDIQKVRLLQEDIIRLYRYDIARYDSRDANRIKRIFDLIPSELNRQNKRFIFRDLDKQAKLRRYEESFLWIADANVGLPAYSVSEVRHPLLVSMTATYFKLYLADVGLLTCMFGMDTVRSVITDDMNVNYGALYENAVAQELVAHGHRLFYFRSKRFGEVDFVIEYPSGEVLPVEVKSGKDYRRHRALDNILATPGGCSRAVVLHEGNIERSGAVCYLPVYLTAYL
jgi:predicted AAA+ superfamily ATPase